MGKKVSIEVGHGGSDPGAVCGSVREKDINLVVSLELKRQLERHGVEVLISRTSDVNDKAADFYTKAQSYKPDAGVSVHTNAFNGAAAGFEVYRSTNSYKVPSNLLCAYIETQVKKLGQTSRGVKDSNFLMSSLSCPTAYCELGFLDNAEDYKKFDTAEKQKAFGTAYAKGVLEYFGVDWVNESSGSSGTGATASEKSAESSSSSSTSTVTYRVVAGSYSEKKNAEAQVKTLKAKGFDCFIAEYKL